MRWKSSPRKRLSKDGDLRQTLQESATRVQAVRIASTVKGRRTAQAWVNDRGGTRVFAVFFWHSEGSTPRDEALMEAVIEQTRTTRHPWMVASDDKMNPEDFEEEPVVQRESIFIEAPEKNKPTIPQRRAD